MRRIITLIFVASLVVGAAWWIGHLAGGISLIIGGTHVDAPLPVGVLALLLLVAAVYVLTRVLATILHLPGAFRRGGQRRNRRRGDDAVTQTLTALAAREPADARRQASRARRLLGDTPQTLLLSAYAGSIAGDEAEAEAAFEKLTARKESAFLGYRGLLRLAIQREDYERAAELARAAEAAHPGAAWLRDERTQLALRTRAWSEALHLTTDDAPKASFGAAAAEASTDPATAHRLAKAAFKRDPALPAAAVAYARRLRQAGRERAAMDVLRRGWAASPNPAIADFALEPAADRRARLNKGIDLVRNAPTHSESELLLARLSLDAGEPADALRYAEAARAQGIDQRRLYLLLADIAESQGDDAAQRAALRSAATASGDPEWRCEHCSSLLPEWSASCPICHVPGKVKWSSAYRPVRLALPAS